MASYTTKRGNDSKGNPGEWHIYPNGRKVFISDASRSQAADAKAREQAARALAQSQAAQSKSGQPPVVAPNVGAPIGRPVFPAQNPAVAPNVGAPIGPSVAAVQAGQPHERVNPFLTPDEQMRASDELFEIQDAIRQLNKQWEDLNVNTAYEKTNVDKREAENHKAVTENMIARGLFRSSIKDDEIADVTAAATARKTYLDTTLKTAQIDRDNRVGALAQRQIERFGATPEGGDPLALGDGGQWDQVAAANAYGIEKDREQEFKPLDLSPLVKSGPAPAQPIVAPTTPGAPAPAAEAIQADANRKAADDAKAREQAAKAYSQSQARKPSKPKKPTLTAQYKPGKALR